MSRLMVSTRRPTYNHLDFLVRAVWSFLDRPCRDSETFITNSSPGDDLGKVFDRMNDSRIGNYRCFRTVFRHYEFLVNNHPLPIRLLLAARSSLFPRSQPLP